MPESDWIHQEGRSTRYPYRMAGHAFVAPQEPATPRATVRRCTRHSPLHWHVDQGDFDVEFATEEEANAEAARLNTFGDTETPPAPTTRACEWCFQTITIYSIHDPRGHAVVPQLHGPGYCVPAPLDSEPREPPPLVDALGMLGFEAEDAELAAAGTIIVDYDRYHQLQRDAAEAIRWRGLADTAGFQDRGLLAVGDELIRLRATLATHTRSLAALRSALVRLADSRSLTELTHTSLDHHDWRDELLARIDYARATLSETQP